MALTKSIYWKPIEKANEKTWREGLEQMRNHLKISTQSLCLYEQNAH